MDSRFNYFSALLKDSKVGLKMIGGSSMQLQCWERKGFDTAVSDTGVA